MLNPRMGHSTASYATRGGCRQPLAHPITSQDILLYAESSSSARRKQARCGRYAGVPSSPACQWRTCARPQAALGLKALGGAFWRIMTLVAKFMGCSLRMATDATIARQDTHMHNEKEGLRVQRERMCQCHRMSHLAAARRNSVRSGGRLHANALNYWRKRNTESIR
jgi:hypothetical protein